MNIVTIAVIVGYFVIRGLLNYVASWVISVTKFL